MIDQLIKLVQNNAGNDIVKNPAIPDQHNAEAIDIVGKEIIGGLKNEGINGNITALTSLLQGSNAASFDNPIISTIISNVAGKFAARFGISPQTATQIASSIIPKVMSQFVTKSNDPNDKDFDLQDVLKNICGGSNIGDLIGQFTGGSSKGGLGGLFGK